MANGLHRHASSRSCYLSCRHADHALSRREHAGGPVRVASPVGGVQMSAHDGSSSLNADLDYDFLHGVAAWTDLAAAQSATIPSEGLHDPWFDVPHPELFEERRRSMLGRHSSVGQRLSGRARRCSVLSSSGDSQGSGSAAGNTAPRSRGLTLESFNNDKENAPGHAAHHAEGGALKKPRVVAASALEPVKSMSIDDYEDNAESEALSSIHAPPPIIPAPPSSSREPRHTSATAASTSRGTKARQPTSVPPAVTRATKERDLMKKKLQEFRQSKSGATKPGGARTSGRTGPRPTNSPTTAPPPPSKPAPAKSSIRGVGGGGGPARLTPAGTAKKRPQGGGAAPQQQPPGPYAYYKKAPPSPVIVKGPLPARGSAQPKTTVLRLSRPQPLRQQGGKRAATGPSLDDEDAAIKKKLEQHNKKFKTQHSYVPTLSFKDTRRWEEHTGKQYRSLTFEQREAANAEIRAMKAEEESQRA